MFMRRSSIDAMGSLARVLALATVAASWALGCAVGTVPSPGGASSQGTGTGSGGSSGGGEGFGADAGGFVSSPPALDAGGFGGGTVGNQPVYNPVVTASVAPPPISGGTLAISSDGRFAFAADPDRDALYVVDLTAKSSVTVALQAGDEPGRVIEDGAGNVHVVLRSGGAVATINPTSHSVVARTPVCARPRGIAYMASTDALYVTCAGGELVTVPASGSGAPSTVFVEPDLRDAVVIGSNLYVSELRSAMVLQIAADGSIANRFTRPNSPLQTGVAWRMISLGDSVAVSLQAASTSPISPAPGSYGTGGCGGAVTNPEIVVWTPDGTPQATMNLAGVLPVDLALSPDGKTFAVVVPGEWLVPGSPQLALVPNAYLPEDAGTTLADGGPGSPGGGGGCGGGVVPVSSGQAIAVAYDAAGHVLVQTREPAQLIFDATDVAGAPLLLSTVSRDDTGHEIFHSDQGGSIACASCHVEGGDDGRVWLFSDVGQRRTPSVLGTVQGTAPYHWDGSQTDLPMLYTGSLARMSGPSLSSDQQTAFTSWLDALPGPAAIPGDAATIARGQALFTGAGNCASCHSGARFTNNKTVDVGTGQAFQVPPLVGVSARAPYLHNGCAPTLVEAIGACGHASTHGGSAGFTSAQLSDLSAYLESL